MKRIFITLIFSVSLSAFSQSIEIMAGLNKNSFFEFQKEGHYQSSHESKLGYTIRVGIDSIKLDWMLTRLTLSFDKYGGEVHAGNGGLGGGNSTNASIDKSVISLGIFPFNFKIINRIDLNFGVEVSGLISEGYKGRIAGWSMNPETGSYDNWSRDLKEEYNSYGSKVYFGLRGRIAYDFYVSDKLAISPQYSYFLGLSKEFTEFPETTKSMRHYFCLGLQYKCKF